MSLGTLVILLVSNLQDNGTAFRCALLDRSRRHYASEWQQWQSGRLPVRHSGVGYMPTPTGIALAYTTGQAQAISNCIGLGLNNGSGGLNALWWPDLRTNQTSAILATMVRF